MGRWRVNPGLVRQRPLRDNPERSAGFAEAALLVFLAAAARAGVVAANFEGGAVRSGPESQGADVEPVAINAAKLGVLVQHLFDAVFGAVGGEVDGGAVWARAGFVCVDFESCPDCGGLARLWRVRQVRGWLVSAVHKSEVVDGVGGEAGAHQLLSGFGAARAVVERLAAITESAARATRAGRSGSRAGSWGGNGGGHARE